MSSASFLLYFLACSLLTAAAPRKPWSTARSSSQSRHSFGTPGRNASYDYVIIGGGTAGLVVAARLAEDLSNSVAVIEAGGFYQVDNGNLSTIPANAIWFAGASPTDVNPLVDWGFVTTPQAASRPENVRCQ